MMYNQSIWYVVGHLKCFFCQISLPLDLYVKACRNVRDKDVNQLAHPKDNMLKDDDKGKLYSQDFPVNRCKKSFIISEASVITFRLKMRLIKIITSDCKIFVNRCSETVTNYSKLYSIRC